MEVVCGCALGGGVGDSGYAAQAVYNVVVYIFERELDVC